MAERWSGVERVAAAELDAGRLDISAHSQGVFSNHWPSHVHFIGE
jgi:hypothetical protein